MEIKKMYDKEEFEVMQRVAKAMVVSGYFKDVRDIAQAVVKIQAGKELGFPAFASLMGIDIIQGKPALSSRLQAALIKRSPRYDYKIKTHSDQVCVLEFYENGELLGEVGYSIEEAQAAGLLGKDNWKKYPSDMLFARAISRGVRRFAPDVTGGAPFYTPEELGAEEDRDGYVTEPGPKSYPAPEADVVDGSFVDEVVEELKDDGVDVKVSEADVVSDRPYPPSVLRLKIRNRATHHAKANSKPQVDARKIVAKHLDAALGSTDQRYLLLDWLFGVGSTKDLMDSQVLAILDWLGVKTFKDQIDLDAEAELTLVARKLEAN